MMKKVGEEDPEAAGKLLNDIETIGKALFLDKSRSKRSLMSSTASSRSKSVDHSQLKKPDPKSKFKEDNYKDSMMEKDKKSIWNWKGFKALTHARDRRFNCYFTLHVHSVEGLPPFFDDLNLVVHWKRRDGELTTSPSMVCQGIAEFDEQLGHLCSVYGRSGNHHAAKYEAKHFLLYASIYGTPEVDLGKHRVDLTRLLPLTLEELDEEKNSGKWTTSYRLSGEAKGGVLNVSFGYEVVGNNRTEPSVEKGVSRTRSFRQNSECRVLRQTDESNEQDTMRQMGSLLARSSNSNNSFEDIHEVLPPSNSELSDSITMLYKKLDEEKLDDQEEFGKPEIDPFDEQKLDDQEEFGKPEIDSFDEQKLDDQEEFGKPEIDPLIKPDETIKQDLHFSSDTGKENDNDECDPPDFSAVDKGTDFLSYEQENSVPNSTNAAHYSTGTHDSNGALDMAAKEETSKEAGVSDKELLMKELELALTIFSDLGKEGLDSLDNVAALLNSESHQEVTPSHTPKREPINLDDATSTVANEFLDLLGIEHSPFGLSSESDPESPRERLLRQFEKDTLAGGFSLFGLDDEENIPEMVCDTPTELGWGVFSQDCEPSFVEHSSEELFHIEAEAMNQKTKASILEDLETEALMREWGLDEKAFQGSPPPNTCGFGSPIDMPQVIPELPSLGQGLGPFVQTKNGEFLRSMNPALFRSAKNGGSLIMQASRPVVMPAEMGSGVMDILQSLASIGIEKLSMQANKLMPLEDINGMTIQQIAWEAAPTLDDPERGNSLLLHESGSGKGTFGEHTRIKGTLSKSGYDKFQSNSIGSDRDSEYVSFEDLAPLAIDKIEALAIEGLKIQSGMSDDVASANINQQSIGEFSALEGKRVGASGSINLEGAGGLQLMDIKDNGDDVDGLMGLSLTLDEWMRLDSGDIYDEDGISERTSKLLAAHHSKSMDMIQGRSKGEKRQFKGRNYGLLGNNFNVALMVQLRDPLRDYEPVGAPMLALIQVERVFIPPKPKIYSSVSELRDGSDEDDDKPTKKDIIEEEPIEVRLSEEEQIPQFKITEVHVAGLKTEPAKNKLWGSATQQQSGSRWLLANGMGKKNKHPLMKLKAGSKSSLTGSITDKTSVQTPGDALWSVSSGSRMAGAKQKEVSRVNSHILNPEVPLRNEPLRLQQRRGFLGFI